jgi:hypothetical protein
MVLRLCNISEYVFYGSRGSVVGITTAYGLDDPGVEVRVPVGSRIFTSPHRPGVVWSPPSHPAAGA